MVTPVGPSAVCARHYVAQTRRDPVSGNEPLVRWSGYHSFRSYAIAALGTPNRDNSGLTFPVLNSIVRQWRLQP